MWRFRLIPDRTNIPFLRLRRAFFVLSIVLAAASIAVLFARGLNFGIDFAGGILIEVGTEGEADIGRMRGALEGLGLGEIALQEFGSDNEVLIRIERQPGDATAQQAAVGAVREALGANYGEALSYRRVETVGPKVGAELIQAGIIAVVVSVFLMLVYIWFRFELPFALGAVVALVHDVLLSLGIFAALGLEFNLPIVAAILLIVGYSMNDTVVVYDRVRENLRKYKTMPLLALLDRSVNETLSRTVITSATTLLALLALLIFGGAVIRDFSFAMIWGVIVGTYSSVFIAGALLALRATAARRPEEGGRPGGADRRHRGGRPARAARRAGGRCTPRRRRGRDHAGGGRRGTVGGRLPQATSRQLGAGATQGAARASAEGARWTSRRRCPRAGRSSRATATRASGSTANFTRDRSSSGPRGSRRGRRRGWPTPRSRVSRRCSPPRPGSKSS